MTDRRKIPPGGFFVDRGLDFDARLAIGLTATGVGDVGDVFATLDDVVGEDHQSWFGAWYRAGASRQAEADSARATQHHRSAGWHYLAAAECFQHALNVVDGLADQSVLMPTFRRHRQCWEAAVDESEGRFVRLDVPYEGATLPGYLLRPDASGVARPTLIMTNGSDGSLPALYGSGASEALARGWNAFLYDGPGQQSMLRDRGVPFRFDWEAVLTPVVDALMKRPDVDGAALTGYGISQAGYWLPRALAFEHRLVAAVVDPAVVDVSASWTDNLPKELVAILQAKQRDVFNAVVARLFASDPALGRAFAFRSRPYGITDPYDVFTEVQKYHLRDVAALIRTPLLVTDPEDEQFWPGQSPSFVNLLRCRNESIHFTRKEGGNLHCQPMARRLTELRMFDWLADRLAESSKR